jgi:hypothetical protein
MAGFYRIAVQGWEPKKAYSEARDVGMRWWYPGLKRQLQAFKRSLSNTPPLAELKPLPQN